MAKYKITDTPSGLKSLIYVNSREIRLHSAYNPMTEAERSVNEFNPGRVNFIIVLGLGLGYHVKCLREKFPDHTIIIAEKDNEVIETAKKINPEYINNLRIVKSSNDLIGILEETEIADLSGISAYIHRQSYSLYKTYYDSLLNEAKEYLSSRFSDLLTRFEFEKTWVDNIFRNIYRLYSAIPVSGFFGKFPGIPGIIVSAGPSLRKNVKLLNRLKNKALIVCVDTALRILIKNDIKPHFVMTLDSQKYSLKHFIGIDKPGTTLIADIVCYPRVLDSFNGDRVLSATTKYYVDNLGRHRRETTPVWDWIEQYIGSVGDIQSGGSVATSVFDLLLNLKCSPIILVGQDLAYTGREIHCSGTYHNDEWLPLTGRLKNLETINQNIIRKRKIKYVQGYNGKQKVLTDFVFDVYRRWFRDSAGKVGVEVINATEGGVRIENTLELSLLQVCDKLQELKDDPESILMKIVNSKNKLYSLNKLLNGIEKGIDDLKILKENAEAHSTHPCFEKEILEFIDKSGISMLLKPFLRKTLIYLNRHSGLPSDRIRGLLSGDIKNYSEKLISTLESSKQNLEKIR